jgi:hypothetical protein
MKIIRFDTPNHTAEQVKTVLSTIGCGFESHDESAWLVGIEEDNKNSCLTDFFEAIGFKYVMVVSIDDVKSLFVNSQDDNTITLTKYVLVYRMYDNKTFCFSAINPTFKAKVNADYIFAPGVYPIPMKDRYGIFSNSHPQIPSDSELMRLMGR